MHDRRQRWRSRPDVVRAGSSHRTGQPKGHPCHVRARTGRKLWSPTVTHGHREQLPISARHEVASRVRAARVAQLWTQEELAQRAGIGRATIARIETGTWVPRMRTVRALAE